MVLPQLLHFTFIQAGFLIIFILPPLIFQFPLFINPRRIGDEAKSQLFTLLGEKR